MKFNLNISILFFLIVFSSNTLATDECATPFSKKSKTTPDIIELDFGLQIQGTSKQLEELEKGILQGKPHKELSPIFEGNDILTARNIQAFKTYKIKQITLDKFNQIKIESIPEYRNNKGFLNFLSLIEMELTPYLKVGFPLKLTIIMDTLANEQRLSQMEMNWWFIFYIYRGMKIELFKTQYKGHRNYLYYVVDHYLNVNIAYDLARYLFLFESKENFSDLEWGIKEELEYEYHLSELMENVLKITGVLKNAERTRSSKQTTLEYFDKKEYTNKTLRKKVLNEHGKIKSEYFGADGFEKLVKEGFFKGDPAVLYMSLFVILSRDDFPTSFKQLEKTGWGDFKTLFMHLNRPPINRLEIIK